MPRTRNRFGVTIRVLGSVSARTLPAAVFPLCRPVSHIASCPARFPLWSGWTHTLKGLFASRSVDRVKTAPTPVDRRTYSWVWEKIVRVLENTPRVGAHFKLRGRRENIAPWKTSWWACGGKPSKFWGENFETPAPLYVKIRAFFCGSYVKTPRCWCSARGWDCVWEPHLPQVAHFLPRVPVLTWECPPWLKNAVWPRNPCQGFGFRVTFL